MTQPEMTRTEKTRTEKTRAELHPLTRVPRACQVRPFTPFSLVLTLLLALSTLAAGALAQPLTSLPIEEVLDGPIALEVSAEAATLTVTTTIDLACVVVFGEDESFGRLALDQDMDGGAHQDHLVFLRGLTPDTDYVYRLQGSDAAGNVYASEILSFRTPPAEAGHGLGDNLGENLALASRGAVVEEVSSAFGGSGLDGSFGGNNAIDGDQGSEWSSAGDGDAASITVRLAAPARVTGFGLWTRTMGTSAEITLFEVENEDGERFGPFELDGANRLYVFPAEGSGERFTFRVLESSGGNTGVVELAVFGELESER